MVIDTSALTAILRKEVERETLLRALAEAPTRLLSAVTALEACMVIAGRYGEEALSDLVLIRLFQQTTTGTRRRERQPQPLAAC